MYRSLVAAVVLVALGPATIAQAARVTVERGDTLAGITSLVLGDADRWQEVCELNRPVLRNRCDFIVPGMVLSLPPTGPLETVVAGPVGLDATWKYAGLTLSPDGTVSSQQNLLRVGVYDPVARGWLVEPAEYVPTNGASTVRFVTGPETTSVRVYPLRGTEGEYAFKVVEGLQPSTTYEASWKVATSPAYSVTDLTISGE